MYEIVESICEFRALNIKSQQDVIESISVKANCQGKTMHVTSNFSRVIRRYITSDSSQSLFARQEIRRDVRKTLLGVLVRLSLTFSGSKNQTKILCNLFNNLNTSLLL